MKTEDYIIHIIECYVNNEIDYIYQDSTDLSKEDLKFLENLTWNDYCNIFKNIEDNTDLMDTINETIHEYLYDYEKQKKEV